MGSTQFIKRSLINKNLTNIHTDHLNFHRTLHLAPPFLVEDYIPVAQKAFESGLLKVMCQSLRFKSLTK